MAFARLCLLQAGIQNFVSNRVVRLVKSRFVSRWTYGTLSRFWLRILIDLRSYLMPTKRLEVDRGIAMSERTLSFFHVAGHFPN